MDRKLPTSGLEYLNYPYSFCFLPELAPEYLAELKQKPQKMVELVQHHLVPGKVQKPDLVGDSDLPSMSPMSVRLKVNVDRQVSKSTPTQSDSFQLRK